MISLFASDYGSLQALSETGAVFGFQYAVSNAIVSAVAIYCVSYRMLKIWRAMQPYDEAIHAILSGATNSKENQRKTLEPHQYPSSADLDVSPRHGIPEPAYDSALLLGAVCILTIPLWSRLFLQPDPTRYSVFMIINAFMGWLGLNTVITALFPRQSVYRSHGGYGILMIGTASEDAKRSVYALVSACILSIYNSLCPLLIIRCAVMAGMIYHASLFLPSMFTVRLHWISVRGAAKGILTISLMALLVFTCITAAVLLFFATMAIEDDTETLPVDFIITMHLGHQIYSSVSGILIALVLRYEYSLAFNHLPQDVCLLIEEAYAVKESDGYIPPSDAHSVRIRIPSANPSFRAPLFHLSLTVYIILHIPAILLGMPQLQHLTSSSESTPAQTFFLIMSTAPGQLWGFFVLPAMLCVAAIVRSDGPKFWRYSERWYVVHDPREGNSSTGETTERVRLVQARIEA